MAAGIALDFNNSIFMKFASLFARKKENVSQESPAEIVSKEIDGLWAMIREKNENADGESDIECELRITESFNRLRGKYSDEQLDGVYMWPRFVKVAIHCVNSPVDALVNYVTEDNYIPFTKRLSDLTRSVQEDDDKEIVKNAERFSEAVYKHILQSIKACDIPSCLAIGRAAQKRGDYDEARKWYAKIMETTEPFNGLTALLACYEEETKAILAKEGSNDYRNTKLKERVRGFKIANALFMRSGARS